MRSGLNKDLIFLVLQYLNEEKFKETAHNLERESCCFFNMNYFEELVLDGNWKEAEKYLFGFTKIEDNSYSKKIFFELRKQKYLEALDAHDLPKASDILVEELKVFASTSEHVFKEMTQLLTKNNFREHKLLAAYTTTKNARITLMADIKKLFRANPVICDKLSFPKIEDSRLRNLISQSFNWQHKHCRNPNPNPEMKTLFTDHKCSRQLNDPYARPSTSNQPNGSTSQVDGFLTLATNGTFQPTEVPVQTPFNIWMPTIPIVNRPAVSGGTVSTPIIPVSLLNSFGDSEDFSKSRASGISDRAMVPVMHPGETSSPLSNITDELPLTVVRTVNPGSCPVSMDFHPSYPTLLLVGTSVGDIGLWEVGSAKVVSRNFELWDINSITMALKSSLCKDPSASVNRIRWCPDGSFFGVTFSKHVLHLYSYLGNSHIVRHKEIDAHIGSVNDLAFAHTSNQLTVITCGDDTTIKVWHVTTGAELFTFKGHEAPVYSLCLHIRDTVHFLLSTSLDGKIKVWWLNDTSKPRIDYEAPVGWCTTMAYSADGKRLFSCGTNQNGETYLLEWGESEGGIKRTYQGLHKHSKGILQFDTTKNRLLAAGDDHLIKFWDMDYINLLKTFDAGGGLPATPRIRFNKEGTLLAVSTNDNRIKILASRDGIRLMYAQEAHYCAASRIAADSVTKKGETKDSEGLNLKLHERGKTTKIWKLTELSGPLQCRSLALPVSVKINKISKLVYLSSGKAILALASNAVHLLWRWPQLGMNMDGKATIEYPPEEWQPPSGILMTNDFTGAETEEALACFALSNNDAYLMSTSGGPISLFNLMSFKTMMTFIHPPPVATYFVFHPRDNNIVAVGLDDSTIQIYDVRASEAKVKLVGHSTRITGLAFSNALNLLVSAGSDAQIMVWQCDTWVKQKSSFLGIPAAQARATLSDTQVQFHQDQIHFLAVHETQLAIYETTNLECVKQWVATEFLAPISHATFSCDSQLVYSGFLDGAIGIFCATSLQPHCRINPIAYIPDSIRSTVHPTVIAANPQEVNQFAVGLSDGRVFIFEPLKSEGQWGVRVPPPIEHGSPSNLPTAPPVVGSSSVPLHELD